MNPAKRLLLAPRVSRALYLPNVAGNYASTPTNAAIDAVTTDLTIVAWLENFTPALGAIQTIACKRAAAGTAALTQWQFRLDATGELRLILSSGASTAFGGVSTVALPAGANFVKVTFDADNGAAGATTRFYYATGRRLPTAWTQLGTDVVGTLLSAIVPIAQPFTVGALSDDGAANRFLGNVRLVEFAGGIDGAVVSRFDPNRHQSGNTLRADTGETWTVNTSGGNPARILRAA